MTGPIQPVSCSQVAPPPASMAHSLPHPASVLPASPTARSATCGLLCEADERSRKLARLPPGVSDGDDATIWNLLVAQLEPRYARGKRTGDQLRDERDADVEPMIDRHRIER